jgi:leucyl aminopeptidase
VGCGDEDSPGDTPYRKLLASAVQALVETGAKDAVFCLGEIDVKGRDAHWKVRQMLEAMEQGLYRFEQLKSQKKTPPRALAKLSFHLANQAEVRSAEAAVQEGLAIAAGVKLARDLANLPANVCTPTYLADQAKSMKKNGKDLKVQILEQADMEKLQMGALLAVARGSREPPKLIVVEYRGAPSRSHKPVVLVGKGITFDSGGVSIKPAAAMDEMKFDMSGAAAVLGTLTAVMQLKLPLNVVGLIPSCENLPDGNAVKPGDVVTSMSGQTVEILNTDAEGRLVLCDALTYAERYQPAAVVDIATLTGACVIALGKLASGLLGNDDTLIGELLAAGMDSSDRAWQLPLWEEYQELLDTNFADMANVGNRDAGAITGACFLARYTKKYPWAHLDIAGTAWKTGKEKGATGRPVPLLTQFLVNRCQSGQGSGKTH